MRTVSERRFPNLKRRNGTPVPFAEETFFSDTFGGGISADRAGGLEACRWRDARCPRWQARRGCYCRGRYFVSPPLMEAVLSFRAVAA